MIHEAEVVIVDEAGRGPGGPDQWTLKRTPQEWLGLAVALLMGAGGIALGWFFSWILALLLGFVVAVFLAGSVAAVIMAGIAAVWQGWQGKR